MSFSGKKKDSMSSYNVLKSSEDIVRFLYVNVYKQKQRDFYENLQPEALQKLIAANFEEGKLSHEHAVFIVNLVHKQPFILNIAFDMPSFDFKRVFGFLSKKQITMNRVRALEEMFLPFCKKNPQKVLDMLYRKPAIKKDILDHLYLRNIYKFAYTTLFCLKKIQIGPQAGLIEQILSRLVEIIFIFSPQKGLVDKGVSFLDYVEVLENLGDFLEELMQNLSTVYFPLLISFLELLDQEFFSNILDLFQKFRKAEKMRQYSQSLIEIILNFLKLFQSLKINLHRQFTKEEQKLLDEVEKQLVNNLIFIAKKLPFFTDILLEKSDTSLSYSSGQIVKTVGMVKYRILELIEKLLSINELVNLEIDFKGFNFFPVIEFYIEQHKWNNIVHTLILKITELIISNDYINFKKRYLINQPNFSQNLFGHLIANFRNRKYIFLHSFKMMNNGNRCPIYELSKMLVNEMKERSDLNYLMKNFKFWKEFMENDMKEFESKNYKEYVVPENGSASPGVKKRNRSFDFSRSSSLEVKQTSRRTLETFDEILEQIKNSEKWSALEEPTSPTKRFSRKNFVKHFDSIGFLEESQL